MKSIGQKIQQLEGLIGTADVTDWERDFLKSVVDRSAGGTDTTRISAKQIAVIDRIFAKHFA